MQLREVGDEPCLREGDVVTQALQSLVYLRLGGCSHVSSGGTCRLPPGAAA